jgi:hypothetical protein
MVNLSFLTADVPLLPRIRVRGKDRHSLSILQSDRVAFGWQRDAEIGVDTTYPGYEVLRAQWRQEIAGFAGWLEDRLSQPLLPRLVELTYNNAYPIVVDGRARRLSEVFRFVNPDYRPVNAFHVAWSEFVGLPEEGVVNAQAGLASAPPGQRVLGVNYFGIAAVAAPHQVSDAPDFMMRYADKLHDRILDMHSAAVVSGV